MKIDYANIFGGFVVFTKEEVECSYLLNKKGIKTNINKIIKDFLNKNVVVTQNEIISLL